MVDVLSRQAEKVPQPKNVALRRNLRYLGKRLVTYIIVGVISLILNFALPRFIPGDPAEQMIQSIIAKEGGISPIQRQAIYDRYGDPNENVLIAFVRYVWQILQGDFGISVQYYPEKVSTIIGNALGWTLYLSLTSVIVGWIIGTVAGARLGWKPGGRLDTWITPLSMFFRSIPSFYVGIILVWWVGYHNGWLPSQGAYNGDLDISFTNPIFLMSVLIYSILPLFVLIIEGFTGWMFTMRNMMITTVTEDYVQLARAKGLSTRRVRNRYAARNAMLPNFTGLAQAIGGSLTAVILAEGVFTYPGLGSVLTAAQGARDYPMLQAVMLMIIFAVLVFNFIADSVYVFLDPRTRER
ncbi:ABC transporter permease [Micrococcales bacterium 31B]|nr:ABC transporter permease [Micrococcales bacterium 31B]